MRTLEQHSFGRIYDERRVVAGVIEGVVAASFGGTEQLAAFGEGVHVTGNEVARWRPS